MGWNDQLPRERKKVLDLNQAAGNYPLFQAVGDVLIEGLVIMMPNVAAGGALTSIAIRTNTATPQYFLTAADGAVANLTALAQLAWASYGATVILLDANQIWLILAGGPTGVGYLTTTVVKYRPLTPGAYLIIDGMD